MSEVIQNYIQTKSVRGENIYSFRRVALTERDFTEEHITAILGRNEDQDSHNGAGKSNILKILFYVRYGEDLNGRVLEKITKRGEDGHIAEEIFDKNGHTYRILRYRNWTPSKSSIFYSDSEEFEKTKKNTGVRLYIDGILWTSQDGTKTQDFIESILGVSKELFLASVLIKQNGGSPFLQADEKKRQKLISEIQSLEPFNVGEKKIKEIAKNHNKKIESLNQHIDMQKKMIERKKLEISALQAKSEQFKLNKKRQIEEAEAKIKLAIEAHDLESNKTLSKVDIKGPEQAVVDIERIIEDKRQALEDLRSSPQLVALRDQQNVMELDQRTLEQEIKSLEEQVRDEKKLLDQVGALTAQITKLDLQKETIGNYKECENISAVEKDFMSLHSGMSAKTQELTGLEKKLEELKHSLACPTCKRLWDAESLIEKEAEIQATAENAIQAKATIESLTVKKIELSKEIDLHKKWQQVTDLSKQIESLNERINDTQAAITLVQTKRNALQDKTSALTGLRRDIACNQENIRLETLRIEDNLSGQKQEIAALEVKLFERKTSLRQAQEQNQVFMQHEQTLKTLAGKIQHAKEMAKSVSDQPNAFEETIATSTQGLSDLESELSTSEQNLKTAEDDASYIDFWREGMSDAGIRSFCADDFLMLLNEISNEYLEPLYNGDLKIEFKSQKEKSDGEINNKITVKYYLCGEETDLGEVSGGEEGRIELAVNLAISDVAELRAGVKSNVRFLDEPFNGICSKGHLKCLALLNQIARDKNRKFFLISHDPALQNMCKHRITIRKKNGVSEFVENNLPHSSNQGASITFVQQWLLYSESDEMWFVQEGENLETSSLVGAYKTLQEATSAYPDALMAESMEFSKAL